MELTKEQIRTLLDILHKAEYEFVTANHMYVTDRPEAVPDNIKFMIDFSEILEIIHAQISYLEKLVDSHKGNYL